MSHGSFCWPSNHINRYTCTEGDANITNISSLLYQLHHYYNKNIWRFVRQRLLLKTPSDCSFKSTYAHRSRFVTFYRDVIISSSMYFKVTSPVVRHSYGRTSGSDVILNDMGGKIEAYHSELNQITTQYAHHNRVHISYDIHLMIYRAFIDIYHPSSN